MNSYLVVMSTREGKKVSSHLPSFIMPACSPREAIQKIRTMFPKALRIHGTVMRHEPHADQMMNFNE